jgi:transcriptional regulator with XRE-family HTH domain
MAAGRPGRFQQHFGVPRSQVARRAGLSESALRFWDTGETTPTLTNLRKVQRALGELGRRVSFNQLAAYYHLEENGDGE